MSDERKDILGGLEDLDWDNALDEWEKNTFVPEVARDADTNRVAGPLGADQKRPPSESPGVAEPSFEVEPLDLSSAMEAMEFEQKAEGTLIAPVLHELRDDPLTGTSAPLPPTTAHAPEANAAAAPPPELASEPAPAARGSVPRASTPLSRGSQASVAPPRGGLDQLFSRPRGASASRPFHSDSAFDDLTDAERDSYDESYDEPAATRSPSGAPQAREREHLPLDESPSEGASAGSTPHASALSFGNAPSDEYEDVSESTGIDLVPLDGATAEHPSTARAHVDPTDAPTFSTRNLESRLSDFEDDNATVVRDRPSLSDAVTATRFPSGGATKSTSTRISASVGVSKPSYAGGTTEELTATRDLSHASVLLNERPPTRWLEATKSAEFYARITWLEEEARSIEDSRARGRALLAVSELCAIVGDRERAHDFASEARDIAPELPLAWRQARHLASHSLDDLADVLDAEASHSPTPSARAHAVLLAADVLRVTHQGDAAVERWDSACKLDPADTRAPIARAAIALAQNDHTSGALRLSDNSELIWLDKAIATALRLRGIERPGADIHDLPINDGLRHTRMALASGDVVAAAQSAGGIATVAEVSKGAKWLSASIGAIHIASRRAAVRALKALVQDGDDIASRQLAARGVELGDPEAVAAALDANGASFTPTDRAVLSALASSKGGDVTVDPTILSELVDDAALAPLVDALTSLSRPLAEEDGSEAVHARARLVSGESEARALATLGRLLMTGSSVEDALETPSAKRTPTANGVAIEMAVRGKRWSALSEALSNLPTNDDPTLDGLKHIAAAFVAERAGDRERAKAAWVEASERGGFATDSIVRIAAELDPSVDLGQKLVKLAESLPDGSKPAILRLEALARGDALDDEAKAELLALVHRAAPDLGIGAFLSERIAHARGDLDEVLRWIQERRSFATDPMEAALDAVREALLLVDRDADLASSRLEEVVRSRPDDITLRELYERVAPDSPEKSGGAWREARAERATDENARHLWLEAALQYDHAKDLPAMLRAARKAEESGDQGLARVMVERAEFEVGDTTRQTEELLELTKAAADTVARREALERLAELDSEGKKDADAARRWHRSILEEHPLYKPSLRWLEHSLITEGRDDELVPVFEQIARALDGVPGGEVTAHAQHAVRLRARAPHAAATSEAEARERMHEMVRLATRQPEPSLWALRTLDAYARAQKDDQTHLETALVLLERTSRPAERASLLLRASEASARLERVKDARTYLEQAASEDPGDVVTWGFLAEVRERTGDPKGAAEACESLARASSVPDHQLLAWHDAAKIWLDEVNDTERGMSALEAAAEIDASFADVFHRLSTLYTDKGLDAERAHLLEKRLDVVEDEEERVSLEVELSRALADMGDLAGAKARLDDALEKRPDHSTALGAMAELCSREGDWTGAEQAYVRLARLLSDPLEQRAIYERLGEIYSVHAPNLSRAEVALREVLKRSPDDVDVLAKLVGIYTRQGDVQRAAETQQQIVTVSTDPNERLARLIELAKIYENVGRDPRKSEQVLDSARKEFPTSVVALRAMAEFYVRQRQMPAMQILLDRAAADARRAFAQGRFVPSLFEVMHAAFELRGKHDAARVVAATLAAVEGQPSDLAGAEARAVDPRLDDLLSPDVISPALRALLFRAGDALDVISPLDLRVLKATPLPPGTPIGATVGSVATVVGLGALQILVSPHLDRVAIPLSSNPPTLLVGEGLAKVKNERARLFVVVRALKMILARASALLRSQPEEVPGLVAASFNAFNPSYLPQGIDAKRVTELARRIGPALPRNVDPTTGVIALEAAGMLGTKWASLYPATQAWANRVALLAVGDPNAALDAIAWGHEEAAAPTASEARAAWIARHADARELMTFSVSDVYAEARARLGVDH